MANAILSAVWPLQLQTPSEKLVLVALADAAHEEDGVTWLPVRSKRKGKIDLLTKCAPLSERAIQGAIKRLVAQGYLVRFENPGKGVVFIVRATPANAAGVQLPLGLTPANAAGGPADAAGKPSINPQIERNGATAAAPVDKCPISGRVLPAGVPAWLWQAYVDQRRVMGKGMAVHTAVILLGKLDAIAKAGWWVCDVVEKAICNGWTDFHEPSGGRITGIRRCVAGQPASPVGGTAEDAVRLAEIDQLDKLAERLEARARFFASVERRNGASRVDDILADLPFKLGPQR